MMCFYPVCLQNLPQFPLPTHDVIIRYWPPPEFEVPIVFYGMLKPSSVLSFRVKLFTFMCSAILLLMMKTNLVY